jgi:hypothetical protein
MFFSVLSIVFRVFIIWGEDNTFPLNEQVFAEKEKREDEKMREV